MGKTGEQALAGLEGMALEGLLAALTASGQGVVIVDRDLRYRVFNDFLVRLSGIPADAVLGQAAAGGVSALQSDQLEAIWRRVLSGETVTTPDLPVLTPGSGQTVWLAGTCTPVRAATGEVSFGLGLFGDVTERKRAEQQLRTGEQRYEGLVEDLGLGFFQSDLDGRLLYANEALARVVGYGDAAEYRQLSPVERYRDPQVRKRLREILVRDGRVQDTVVEGIRKDGTSCWVSMNLVLQRDAQGKPESILGVLADVTDRQRMEEALRASEFLLRNTLEHAPIAMAILGMDGAVEYMNRRSAEVFGYQLEDVPDVETWWRLAYPDEEYRREVVETWMGLITDAIREGREIEGREYRVVCKDQSVKIVFINGVPVAGKVLAMFEDVTERRLAQQRLVEANLTLERKVEERTWELRRSYEHLENLARQVPGLLFQFQASPEGAARVPYASEAGLERFELLAPGGAVGLKALLDRVVPEDRKAMEEALRVSARTLEAFHAEFRLLRPVQGTCWCSCDASPQLQEDGSVLWHGFMTDVSERKAAERALRSAKEAAEAATRAKSLFLANMSHEIRTPMHAVMGFLELVLNSPLEAQQREDLALAHSRSRDLLVLLDDILDLSRIEADRLTLESQPFSLGEAVDDVVGMFARAAEGKGLRLVREVSPEVPPAVVGDVRRLRQILLNLVGNAIKFTARGQVMVRVERAVDLEEALHFQVQDTGVGISEQDARIIFDPFSQGGARKAGEGGGAGLGLAIARRLTESMGGSLWLESRPGAGSTFHFTARLEAAPRLPGSSQGEPEDPGREPPRKVLVVDDDETCRYLVERVLTKRGHVVRCASSGREALQVLGGEDFDVVLMDVQMPGLDGLETLRSIRSQGGAVRDPRVPVIALTAFAMSGDRERCLAAGADDYLSKPFSARDLGAAVGRLTAC